MKKRAKILRPTSKTHRRYFQKYILPDEGTMDFALMYIPQKLYYEVVNIYEPTNQSRTSRVYPVSPNTLYAHLQVLLQSLQRVKNWKLNPAKFSSSAAAIQKIILKWKKSKYPRPSRHELLQHHVIRQTNLLPSWARS